MTKDRINSKLRAALTECADLLEVIIEGRVARMKELGEQDSVELDIMIETRDQALAALSLAREGLPF